MSMVESRTDVNTVCLAYAAISLDLPINGSSLDFHTIGLMVYRLLSTPAMSGKPGLRCRRKYFLVRSGIQAVPSTSVQPSNEDDERASFSSLMG